MIRFSQEKVLLLHKLITEETGGDPNLREVWIAVASGEMAYEGLLCWIREN